MPSIDIIIPVFNEAENVRPLVERIAHAFGTTKLSYQIIAVDDRSTDRTRAELKKLAQTYPILVLKKQGQPGKAYSILEGARHATSDLICMIDGDLQYPPEVIPAMMAQMGTHGVVVAHRKTYEGSIIRRLGSRTLRFIFGKLLLGIDTDIQSGLKVFKRSLLQSISEDDVTPWALDLPLLHMAVERGFRIGEVDITFEKRRAGSSKLSLMGPTLAIATGAIKLKFSTVKPQIIHPQAGKHMIGAGVITKKQQFITHTTLDNKNSALTTFTAWQKRTIVGLLILIGVNLLLSPLHTGIVLVGILSFVYFVDVIFNFYLILKSLHSPPELSATQNELASLNDTDLPMYSILCPLYKEAHVLPHFLEAIAKLDWPKAKLDVILLFEADDLESIEAAKHMRLPKYVRVVIVPDSQPKTKPKACNYGLNMARGEYLVIFDAEDQPESSQLKKAYLGFMQVGPDVKCLQAKLNYYNPHQNWLTRFFTAEYSLWFDVILTGLQSIQTTIPLGGTSNHFRTKDLLELEGWDPFNVTEDCDLGIRLFKAGYRTAIIDSTTLEEANSNFKNWLRQRSRWIKGYMQTYLTHMRDPKEFMEMQGIHALIFQLTVGGKLAFILINPILWVLTIAYFVLYRFVGPAIESLYPSIVFYMAATSLIFGNFMYIYYYMIGCAKREHWSLIKWIFLVPLYWLMVSIAGAIALYQLIVKPHYWEKTIHGLHLKTVKKTKKLARDVTATLITESIVQQQKMNTSIPENIVKKASIFRELRTRLSHLSLKNLQEKLKNPSVRSGLILIGTSMGANVLNMITGLYIGKQLKLADFAVMNTFTSLSYLIGVPLGAMAVTISHHTAQLLGKHGITSSKPYWNYLLRICLALSISGSLIWLVGTPFFTTFFHFSSPLPILAFIPLLVVTIFGSIAGGYAGGRLLFAATGLSAFIEASCRLFATIYLGIYFQSYIYLSLIFSGFMGMAVTMWFANRGKSNDLLESEYHLPVKFFSLALLVKLSAIAFFSLDNIIVAHYLLPTDTGKYGLLGLVGKMIFFSGSLITSFILPVVSHREGKGESSKRIFTHLTLLTAAIGTATYVGLALIMPHFDIPLFGDKIAAIATLLPIYGFGILFYTIATAILQYHLAKRQYAFAVSSFIIAIFQVCGLVLFHKDLVSVVTVMCLSGFVNFIVLLWLHIYYADILPTLQNFRDLLGIFEKIPHTFRSSSKVRASSALRILIFNWRDTKHVWGGGAEAYIQQIAEEWIKQGIEVTVFCGNDGHDSRNDNVNGVQIIRRGGFYTVYLWAFIYYVTKLRGKYDVIIDSENGIPFFSPLYASVPIFLLVHHIHQDVFRTNLPFPLAQIAAFAESQLMPFVYKNHQIITVSESSRKDILKFRYIDSQKISIVNPGIQLSPHGKMGKTKQPSFCYVGRLKRYKNLDVAVNAFAILQKNFNDASFTIAGEGDSLKYLKRQIKQLKLEKNIHFVGRISELEKVRLLSTSWAMIQPSSFEGWGITVIEANACGTPVIAANVIGLRDSVIHEKTGLLCNSKDSLDFAVAMQLLIKDAALRRRLTREALVWSAHFTWEESGQKFLRILQSGNHQKIKPIYAAEK